MRFHNLSKKDVVYRGFLLGAEFVQRRFGQPLSEVIRAADKKGSAPTSDAVAEFHQTLERDEFVDELRKLLAAFDQEGSSFREIVKVADEKANLPAEQSKQLLPKDILFAICALLFIAKSEINLEIEGFQYHLHPGVPKGVAEILEGGADYIASLLEDRPVDPALGGFLLGGSPGDVKLSRLRPAITEVGQMFLENVLDFPYLHDREKAYASNVILPEYWRHREEAYLIGCAAFRHSAGGELRIIISVQAPAKLTQECWDGIRSKIWNYLGTRPHMRHIPPVAFYQGSQGRSGITQWSRKQARPLLIGSSLSGVMRNTCSLTLFAQRVDNNGNVIPVALTSGHPFRHSKMGEAVHQPSLEFCLGSADDEIGTLDKISALKDEKQEGLDYSLIGIKNGISSDGKRIYRQREELLGCADLLDDDLDTDNLRVMKIGAGTGNRRGKIITAGGVQPIITRDGCLVLLKDCFEIEKDGSPFSGPRDSGALVLTENQQAVAIVAGGPLLQSADSTHNNVTLAQNLVSILDDAKVTVDLTR